MVHDRIKAMKKQENESDVPTAETVDGEALMKLLKEECLMEQRVKQQQEDLNFDIPKTQSIIPTSTLTPGH